MEIKPRESIMRLARLMEQKLQENDYKGGWGNDTPKEILSKLYNEVHELDTAYNDQQGIERVVLEGADVANYTMMFIERVADEFLTATMRKQGL